MAKILRLAGRTVEGLPYLQKEVARRVSLKTGKVLATPTTYYIIFSGRCNLACPFCTIHTITEPMLPGEVMLRLVRETKELSGKGFNISLSGGEPMIYKPLYDVLELAQKIDVNFGFTTNGLGLTRQNVDRLIAFDPFNVNVSVESIDAKINEALRPFPEGTKRTLEGVDRLLEAKRRTGSRVSVIIKPTIMEQNYRTLPALVRHFGKDGGVQVNFQPYVGRREDPFYVKDLKQLSEVITELKGLQQDGYPIIGNGHTIDGFLAYISNPPAQDGLSYLNLEGAKRNCDIGLRSMFIYYAGDVHFCDFLKQSIGNIYQQSLSEIYYGAVADAQRRRMVYCNIDCMQTCKRPTPLLAKAKAFLRMG
jgi:MoaA/NifB/PqqE/SkfB family radical SAM enzyme